MGNVYTRLKVSVVFIILVLLIGVLGYKFLVPYPVSIIDAIYMTSITVMAIGYYEVINLTGNTPARIFTIFLAFLGIGVHTYIISNVSALLIEGDIDIHFIRRRIKNRIKKLEGHFIICGIGRVGERITQELRESGLKYVFVDQNAEKIEIHKENFEEALGLAGDCTNDEMLLSLGIKKAKGIFACTDDDNINLVICVTAKQLNPHIKVITACKNPSFKKKLISVGADKVVSPYSIGGKRMASEMTRPAITSFLDLLRMNTSDSYHFEEIKVGTHYEGFKLENLELESYENTILIGVKEKNDEWIIHPKNDHIITKDTILLLISTPADKNKIEKKCQ